MLIFSQFVKHPQTIRDMLTKEGISFMFPIFKTVHRQTFRNKPVATPCRNIYYSVFLRLQFPQRKRFA